MNKTIRDDNRYIIDRVNGTIGNHISPTLSKLIVQYYSEKEKIMSNDHEDFYHMQGYFENNKGELTNEHYLRVFIKERDKINIFTELEFSTSIGVITLPNGHVDRTESHYDLFDEEYVMVEFTVYYENGQTFGTYSQNDDKKPEFVAELFKFLTNGKY